MSSSSATLQCGEKASAFPTLHLFQSVLSCPCSNLCIGTRSCLMGRAWEGTGGNHITALQGAVFEIHLPVPQKSAGLTLATTDQSNSNVSPPLLHLRPAWRRNPASGRGRCSALSPSPALPIAYPHPCCGPSKLESDEITERGAWFFSTQLCRGLVGPRYPPRAGNPS